MTSFYNEGEVGLIELNEINSLTSKNIEFDNTTLEVQRLCFFVPEGVASLSELNWQIKGKACDLVILAGKELEISNSVFSNFKNVLLIDRSYAEIVEKGIFFKEVKDNENIFKLNQIDAGDVCIWAKEIYLKGGFYKSLWIKSQAKDAKVDLMGLVPSDAKREGLRAVPIVTEALEIELQGIDSKISIKELSVKGKGLRIDTEGTVNINGLGLDKCYGEINARVIEKASNIQGNKEGLKLNTKSISLAKTLLPRGKFYFGPGMYFSTFNDLTYKGIENNLTLLELNIENPDIGNLDELSFPYPLKVDKINITTQKKLSLGEKVTAGTIVIKDSPQVYFTKGLTTNHVSYLADGDLIIKNGEIRDKLYSKGVQSIIFDTSVKVKDLIAEGLAEIFIKGNFTADIIKLNTGKRTQQEDYVRDNFHKMVKKIGRTSVGLCIENNSSNKVKINNFIGRVNRFATRGGEFEFGHILLDLFDFVENSLLQVDLSLGGKVTIGAFTAGHNLLFKPSANGMQAEVVNRGGNVIASIGTSTYDKGFFLQAYQALSFMGDIKILNGSVYLKTVLGNLFATGRISASDHIILESVFGNVHAPHLGLSAQEVQILAGREIHVKDSYILASNYLAKALSNYIELDSVSITKDFVVISEHGDVSISNSQIVTTKAAIGGSNVNIKNSQFTADEGVFIKALRECLLFKINIDIIDHNFVLFTRQAAEIGQGKMKAIPAIPVIMNAEKAELVGLVRYGKESDLSEFAYEKISESQFSQLVMTGKLKQKTVYIEADTGTLMGSDINCKDQVIIRTKNGFNMIPIPLYNRMTISPDVTVQEFKYLKNHISADVIDIDAGKVANLVSAIFNAKKGSIRADYINDLMAPEVIVTQHKRVEVLKYWFGFARIEHAARQLIQGSKSDFNFTELTELEERQGGGVELYYPYKSSNIALTKGYGDFIIDKPLTQYDNIALKTNLGQILIGSRDLSKVYGGGNKWFGAIAKPGMEAELARLEETFIAAENVFFEADQVKFHGGKIEVTGMMKVVAKHGIFLLPVSVHKSLTHHRGSKTTVTENTVQQVITEINAGLLDLAGGDTIEIVGALINATGVNLDAKQLNIRPAIDVYEEHIYFKGAKKWHGGQQKWEDHVRNEFVRPSIIQADSIYAKIDGNSTIEAAQWFAKEVVTEVNGNLQIKNGYNLHFHDHYSKSTKLLSFHKGSMKFMTSKVSKESESGSDVFPSLICVDGTFYGFSKGKIHIVGSKIVGKDVYLIAPEGVKLEATPFHQSQLVVITESGAKVGYTVKKGEASVGATGYLNRDSIARAEKLLSSTDIVALNHLEIKVSNGAFEMESSNLLFETAKIVAKDWKVTALQQETYFKATQKRLEAGLKAGVHEQISAAIDQTKYLLKKRGDHAVDHLDRFLNGYDLYKKISRLQDAANSVLTGKWSEQQMVTFGAYLSGTAHFSSQEERVRVALDSQVQGGSLEAIIDNDTRFSGINMHVRDFDLKTRNLYAEVSENKLERSSHSLDVDIKIPIPGFSGNMTPSASVGGRSQEFEQVSHNENIIRATGTLKLDIENNGVIRGVKFIASELDVKAKNLIVESVQKRISMNLMGMSMSMDMSKGLSGFNINPEAGNREASWTDQIGMLVGTQVANIVVKEALELAGGIVANAEVDESGRLTDQGKLELHVGSLITKTIEDYDNGLTLGIGGYFGAGKGSEKGLELDSLGIKMEYSDQGRKLRSAIGGGNVTVNGAPLPKAESAPLTRNVNAQVIDEHKEGFGMDAKVPTRDIREFFGQLGKKPANDNPTGASSGEDYQDGVLEAVKRLLGFGEASEAQEEYDDEQYEYDDYGSDGFDEYGNYEEEFDEYTDVNDGRHKDSLPDLKEEDDYIPEGKQEVEDDITPPKPQQKEQAANQNNAAKGMEGFEIKPESIPTVQEILKTEAVTREQSFKEKESAKAEVQDKNRSFVGEVVDAIKKGAARYASDMQGFAEAENNETIEGVKGAVKFAQENPEAVINIASMLPIPGSGIGVKAAAKVGGKVVQGAKVVKNFYDRTTKGVEKFDAASTPHGKTLDGSTVQTATQKPVKVVDKPQSAEVSTKVGSDVNEGNSKIASEMPGLAKGKIKDSIKHTDAASALRADYLAKMEKFKNNTGALDKDAKGILGEDRAVHTMDYLKDYKKIEYKKLDAKLHSNQGIDHVFVKYDANDVVTDIMVVESKFQKDGTLKLAKDTKGRYQLSDAWMKKQIKNLKNVHPEIHKTLMENQDKIRFKANVLDKNGNNKWYDFGKYNPIETNERKKPIRSKKG